MTNPLVARDIVPSFSPLSWLEFFSGSGDFITTPRESTLCPFSLKLCPSRLNIDLMTLVLPKPLAPATRMLMVNALPSFLMLLIMLEDIVATDSESKISSPSKCSLAVDDDKRDSIHSLEASLVKAERRAREIDTILDSFIRASKSLDERLDGETKNAKVRCISAIDALVAKVEGVTKGIADREEAVRKGEEGLKKEKFRLDKVERELDERKSKYDTTINAAFVSVAMLLAAVAYYYVSLRNATTAAG